MRIYQKSTVVANKKLTDNIAMKDTADDVILYYSSDA